MSVLDSGWSRQMSVIPTPQSKLKVSGNDCIEKLIKDYQFNSVLDIGCGTGVHSTIMKDAGKDVTSLDAGHYFDFKPDVIGMFETVEFDKKFDAIWCSHVLEHVMDVHSFLVKINETLEDDGVLAITVPPLKHDLVSGHCNLFNTGTLIYQLVIAGFDYSEAAAKVYCYNLSVIVRKSKKIGVGNWSFPTVAPYFPFELKQNMDGRILSVNWD